MEYILTNQKAGNIPDVAEIQQVDLQVYSFNLIG